MVGVEDGLDNGMYMGVDMDAVLKNKDNAFLGYLSMDVYRPVEGAIWGHFNYRKYVDKWVTSLSEMYEHTLRSCTNDTAMCAAVKRGWLTNTDDELLASVDGKKIHDVPIMTFTEEGAAAIKDSNLWMLSGNHRRQALTIFLDKIRVQQEELKERILELKAEIRNSSEDEPVKKEEVTLATDKIKTLDEKIERSCMWAIKIYDIGALSYKGEEGVDTNHDTLRHYVHYRQNHGMRKRRPGRCDVPSDLAKRDTGPIWGYR